jgi:hypothetical protein
MEDGREEPTWNLNERIEFIRLLVDKQRGRNMAEKLTSASS